MTKRNNNNNGGDNNPNKKTAGTASEQMKQTQGSEEKSSLNDANTEGKPGEETPGGTASGDTPGGEQPGENQDGTTQPGNESGVESPGKPGEETPAPAVARVPNAEEIEQSAQCLAANPELMQACKKTIARAEQIFAENNAPAKKSVEELATIAHERLVKTYGKDFVSAKKGNNRTYFSRKAWNGLGKNKNGWTEVTKEMPEVADAAKAEDAGGAK